MIISCVSGAQINDIQKRLGNDKVEVIRAMPNTAIAFGESMTCVAGLTKQSKGLQITKQIFDHLGVALIVNEDQIVRSLLPKMEIVEFFKSAVLLPLIFGVLLWWN